jgi:hypothetical protein
LVRGKVTPPKNVVIPSTYNGKPVTAIGKTGGVVPYFDGEFVGFYFADTGAFVLGAYEITSIQIPSSVTWIGGGAFFDCNSLPSITIPASVTYIGPIAFERCSSLTSITFQGTGNSFDEYAFYNLGDLRAKYLAGGAGTYKRAAGDEVWTKQ